MTTTIDITHPASVLELASYRSVMFGYRCSAWHFDAWSTRTLAEQLESGEVAEYTRARLTEEIPAHVVADCIATPVQPTRGACDGHGNIHLGYDSDYDCGGCFACKPGRAAIGWSISAFLWSVATGAERERLSAGVRGMQALAMIGAAIEAALSPGRGVSRWIGGMIAEWNIPRKGRWYRVTGRRGRAAEAVGTEGEAAWVGETEYMGRRSLRVGLKTGPGPLVYVSAGSLSPMATPAAAVEARRASEERKAARSALARFDGRVGKDGDVGYVIDGEHRGKHGVVFWRGMSRGEERLGIRVGAGREDVIWVAACDVARDQPAAPGSELQILAEVAVHALCRVVQLAYDAAGLESGFAAPVQCRARKRAAV